MKKLLEKELKFLVKYPNFSIYTEKKKYINKTESDFECINNIGDFNNFITILDSLISQKKAELIKEENNGKRIY